MTWVSNIVNYAMTASVFAVAYMAIFDVGQALEFAQTPYGIALMAYPVVVITVVLNHRRGKLKIGIVEMEISGGNSNPEPSEY